MAERRGRDVARLARLAREIERKRVLCMDLQTRIIAVERTGIAVVGERWMLERLQAWLQEALSLLQTIEDAESPSVPIGELERLLSAPEWTLAEQSRDDLTRLDDDQQRQLRDFQPQLARWQPQIAGLRAQLARALAVRAPINREHALFLKLEAIVARAGRELDEQKLGPLAASLQELDNQNPTLQTMLAGLETKIESSERIVRQADLLLLRSPRIKRSYEFTVLLRTPSTQGSHGVNIQDSSTIVEQDHKRMRQAVDNVTTMINKGLARQFSERSGRAPAAEDAPPQPAETPSVVRDLLPAGSAIMPATRITVNDMVRNVGDLMYDLIMPEEMQRYLSDTPCSITVTTNELELPWELMWDDQSEQGFLCLERPVARMPMGQAFPRRAGRRRLPARELRFLLIYADPTGNLPAASREIDQIKQQLEEDWSDKLDLKIDVLKRHEADGERLNDVLRSGAYDVIHYAGHAQFDRQKPEQSGLLLHGREVLSAEKIRRLLEGRPLVFLNACESGRTANEEKPQAVGRSLQRPAEGLASAFIYGGALGCLGALWPVYDDAAADFAVAFYGKVLEGHMIGEAMRQARLHIRQKYPSQITWAAFLLYGDPTLQLEG